MGFNGVVLSGFPIPLAPLGEQRRIVAKIEELFSDLDAGVAALERVRANLKRYRAAVLKAAVEGKLTEDWRAQHPDTEPASILLERILTERRRQWEKDQLTKSAQAGKQPPRGWQERYSQPEPPGKTNEAELPSGWCLVCIEQLGDVQLGRQRSPRNRSLHYPTKYIRAANITERGIDVSDVLDMDFQPAELRTYRLLAGDIVLSEASGSPDQVGKPAIWNDELDECCFQNTVIRLRPLIIGSRYLLIVFSQFYVNKAFAKVAAGVGINHLSAAKFSRMLVPLPPQAEQNEIVEEVERRLSLVDEIESQVDANLKRAARLRQGILKRAFEGRLVPQDSSDEPAEKLLERTRQYRHTPGTPNNRRTGTRRAGRRRRAAASMPLFHQNDRDGDGGEP